MSATIYEMMMVGVAAATGFILIIQVGLALKSFKADHERRKKQATFEFIQKIRPAWIETKHSLEKRWGKNPLTSKELAEIDNDFELLKKVRNLLGLLEHLSVGMNTEVFDKDLLFRMSGTQIINISIMFNSYIKKVQRSIPTAYIEFEELAKGFEERKRLRPESRGNIIHS